MDKVRSKLTDTVLVSPCLRFLEDIQIAGALSGQQRIMSNIAPISMHLGATGLLVTKAIEGKMKKNRELPVTELIEMWNNVCPIGLNIASRD